ncbi:MAG: glycosyltransferase family 2 protein [Pyrinomonadaceae bacterium]|nr:glycosyltransferase family 2 protein [Pyrinomonadaceae bacterium]
MKNNFEKFVGANVTKNAPKVSIITPAYNIAKYIAETLDSVFAQTFQNYEIIVVNDGSPDTVEFERVLEPYLNKIIYLKQPNKGAGFARNVAIEHARGDLLAFLDGDDVWLPDFLVSQVEFLEKKHLEMAYCDALIFGEPLFEKRTFMQGAPSNGAVTTVNLLSAKCSVITSGTVLKKSLLEKFGLFDAAVARVEDFDLWFRLAKNGARIGYQREVLLKYRVRPDNLSGTNVERAERSVRAMSVVYEKYNLDEAELKVWKRRTALCEAAVELEKGKWCLTQGDFTGAASHLAEANKFYRQPKLFLVNFLMRFSPRLTARLFKKMRPLEFSFISPNNVE